MKCATKTTYRKTQPSEPQTKNVLIVLLIFLAAFIISFLLSSYLLNKTALYIYENSTQDTELQVRDVPYKWVFNYSDDMQLPELPTGCEATAAATLSRMQGAFVSKTQVANALPKSYDDFVYSFMGDPYSYSGWSCSSRAITDTLNAIFSSEEKFAAIELTGDDLDELVLPAAVWVTIDMDDPGRPSYINDGYMLFHNTHCVVITKISYDGVSVIDPLRGEVVYGRYIFESVYNAMGREAVHVGYLDEITRLTIERRNNES